MESSQQWMELSQIAFNLVASIGVLGAALKYTLLSGGARRHTELAINFSYLTSVNGENQFEIFLRIDNKGMQLLELYNVFLHAQEAVSGQSSWSYTFDNIVEKADQKIWLHSGTGINIVKIVKVPSSIDLLEIELVVPYLGKRLDRSWRGSEIASVSDYNSINRFYSTARLLNATNPLAAPGGRSVRSPGEAP